METTARILVDIPAVIIFSFFAATLLNQKFKGRTLARVVFFLPVILTSESYISLNLGYFHEMHMHASQEEIVYSSQLLWSADADAPAGNIHPVHYRRGESDSDIINASAIRF